MTTPKDQKKGKDKKNSKESNQPKPKEEKPKEEKPKEVKPKEVKPKEEKPKEEKPKEEKPKEEKPKEESKSQEKPQGSNTKERKDLKKHKLKTKLKIAVPIPEGLKKTWERKNRTKILRRKRDQAIRKKLPAKREKQAKRIEKYEKIYERIKRRRQEKIFKARKAGNFFKPSDAKVAIVIRIRGINRTSPKVRKVLQLFRLLQIHNAVFIRINKATMNMLKLIQPYIAYGYPNVSTIRSLIYKRGFAKIKNRPGSISRIPIMSNKLIEKYLGKSGIQTVEDMVYHLYTGGKAFKKVSNFLWPFKLNPPKKGYRGRKRYHFNEGGSYGNWEYHINTFVTRMI